MIQVVAFSTREEILEVNILNDENKRTEEKIVATTRINLKDRNFIDPTTNKKDIYAKFLSLDSFHSNNCSYYLLEIKEFERFIDIAKVKWFCLKIIVDDSFCATSN